MDSAPEPEWNRLPHEPEAFFGLEATFDRKDLKRAYNRLIRRFKPEKFPEEFQKIRAAYEQLDRRLRYGQSAEAPFSASPTERSNFETLQIEALLRAANEANVAKEQTRQQRDALLDSLASVPSSELYDQLKAKTERNESEYLLLAFLSDLHEDRPQAFLAWLLAGLKRHPRSRSLLPLLQAYLAQEHLPQQLPGILRTVASTVSNDRFYYLTETLWLDLLDAVPFEQFRELLAECESRLTDYRIGGRITFYVQVLRKAMWFADPEWIERTLRFLSENQRELGPHLEYDLEINDILLDYIRIRKTFLNGNPIRHEIDQTIYRYCVLDDLPALQTLLNAQRELLQNADALLDAFPVGDMSFNPVYLPWCWMAQEAEAQVGHERREMQPRELGPRISRLLRDIAEQTTGLRWRLFELADSALGLLVNVYPAAVAVLIGLLIPGAWSKLAGLTVAVGLYAINAKWLTPRVIEPARVQIGQKIMFEMYNSIWRRELLDFLRLTHVPVEEVRDMVEVFDSDEESSYHYPYIEWVSLFLQQDFGLAFYSLAQQFQK